MCPNSITVPLRTMALSFSFQQLAMRLAQESRCKLGAEGATCPLESSISFAATNVTPVPPAWHGNFGIALVLPAFVTFYG